MSQRIFAFLRAINTGNRRVTNDELIAPFVALGLTDVAAYQAAGNLTFRTGDDPIALEQRLDDALTEAFGFDAPTFVRTADEVDDAISRCPFTDEQLAGTQGRVQLTFLRTPPGDDTIAAAMALVPDDDLVEIGERDWFWLPRAGVSDSTLPVGRLEAQLGPMTMRTLGTVERMRSKFSD